MHAASSHMKKCTQSSRRAFLPGSQGHSICDLTGAPSGPLQSWVVGENAGHVCAGQVNTVSRDAAMSPGASDTLAAFAGTYSTLLLPTEAGEEVRPGAEITITVNSAGDSRILPVQESPLLGAHPPCPPSAASTSPGMQGCQGTAAAARMRTWMPCDPCMPVK